LNIASVLGFSADLSCVIFCPSIADDVACQSHKPEIHERERMTKIDMAWCPDSEVTAVLVFLRQNRSIDASMSSADLVHRNGFGSVLGDG
jgi:hypothetical protein